MNKKIIIGIILAALALGAGYLFRDRLVAFLFAPQEPMGDSLERGLQKTEVRQEDVAVVVRNLEIPWEIAFLPNGDLLVTERTGSLLRVGQDEQVFEIEGVAHVGEGGLLGLALHPEFEENNWIYLYLTTQVPGGLENRVERYVLQGDSLLDRQVILSGIPGAQFHDGGRIEFGPDGLLYITAGDAGNPSLAQDTSSLAGKILRLQGDGSIPDDNPFGNAVYSFGHRNPQGLVWDEKERLWSTEHGRSGPATGFDELNLIEKGKNYGWPEIQGDERQSDMESPELHSGPVFTWAPGDVEWLQGDGIFAEGSLFFAGLRGEALYEVQVTKAGLGEIKIHFFREYGRLRAVRLGPDGMLYLTTSNRDGRGQVRTGDDKIIRINPAIFQDL